MAKQNVNVNVAPYHAVFTNWPKAQLGSKPAETELGIAHAWGRPGKQSLALAMMLRAEGATATQVKLASAKFDGNPTPHFNKMRMLVKGGVFQRAATPGLYKLSLTPQGKADMARWAKAKGAVETPKAETPAKAPSKAAGQPKAAKPRVAKPKAAKPTVSPEAVKPEAVMIPPSVAPAEVQPTA